MCGKILNMENTKAKLIVTDSRFGLFDILVNELGGAARGACGKNLVFCEEKVSLMAERRIAREAGASINTAVYSFGNYLRIKRAPSDLLSKEGSAMVIKKILSSGRLLCFNASRTGLAPSLYELIMQLKSAAVDPETVERAAEQTKGILSNKLKDVASVFSVYERYLREHGLKDQSSALSELPDILKEDKDIEGANVIILGYTGFTAQIRNVMRVLLKRAAKVTAVLTGGRNGFVFVNETAAEFSRLAREAGARFHEERVKSDYLKEGAKIVAGMFDPAVFSAPILRTERIKFSAAENRRREIYNAACIIKKSVMRGECRYKDYTMICPDKDAYRRDIEEVFGQLEIPFFLDEKKKPGAHPLITLILSYIEIFRRGYSKEALAAFFKNPLVCEDRALADKFENYMIKYNVEYGAFRRPLVLAAESEEQLLKFEEFRKKICAYLSRFDAEGLLKACGAEEKLAAFTARLTAAGEAEEAAVNEQIAGAVKSLLSEMKGILGDGEISYNEYRQVFMSGVAAMELSIIPQYNDAVFIGGFKEAALVKARRLFAVGLVSSVPEVKEDVALLSDGDINALSEIKVLVEPSIGIVNRRAREETALGLAAFSETLYLSYPVSSGGRKNVKSELLSYLQSMFTFTPFPQGGEYLTLKQGLNAFAREAGRFAAGLSDDFTLPAAFYAAEGGKEAGKIAEYAGKEIKERLSGGGKALIKDVTSPTAIEDFYRCPYRSFMEHVLGAEERRSGALGGLSAGVLMHEIFYEFLSRAEDMGEGADYNALFNEVAKQITEKDDYKKFTQEARLKEGLAAALNECRKFCFKTLEWLRSSEFKTERRNLEAKFGDGPGCAYPAVRLAGGRVKLSGKIDRVDTYKNYFRVIDYKTGGTDDSDKGLFSGTKLQLYLYAAAVAASGKEPAGAYYMRVADPYLAPGEQVKLVAGKTLDVKEALAAQDNGIFERESPHLPVTVSGDKTKGAVSARTMSAFISYALKVSERAVSRLEEGVIVPSPYERACEYCPFAGVCGAPGEFARSLCGVTDEVIEQAGEDTAAEKGERDA